MKQRETTNELSFRAWLGSCIASERATVAQLWGVEHADATDARAADALADTLLTAEAVNRVLAQLAPQERAALARVQAEGGRIAAPALEREFGKVRIHTRYPNPRTFLLALPQPSSAAERLFLLGLLQVETVGPRAIFAIPADLRPLLPPTPLRDRTLRLTGEPAPPLIVEAGIWELEHNCGTILILAQAGALEIAAGRGLNKASMLRLAQRWGMSRDELRGITYEQHWRYLHFLRLVMQSAGLLRVSADNQVRPTADALAWLQSSRLERLRRLVAGWATSDWDELARFLGIETKGHVIDRDAAAARHAILGFLAQAPPAAWVAWETLLAEVKRVSPDFARPSGDYESWRLVDYRGRNLDGFANWERVEGELLKATIGGSLRWLGLTDYGGGEQQGAAPDPRAFRLNPLGAALLEVGPPPAEPPYERLVVQGSFEVVAPPRVAPFYRFQLSRIAAWVSGSAHEEAEIYRLTKATVQAAVEQGIPGEAISAFLEEAGGAPLPPNVAYSLREWAGQHGQLTLRKGAILQTDDPLLLEQVRRDRRLRLPPVEALTEGAWLLGEGDAARLAEALRKAGYGLAGTVEPDGPPLKERDLTVLAGALHFYAAACARLQVESEASGALLGRVERLLSQRQRDTAARIAAEALAALETHRNRER